VRWIAAVVAVVGCGFPADSGGDDDDAPADAPVIADARGDASRPPDAYACNAGGLQCPGQPAVDLTSCGQAGECWAGCTNGDPIDVADAIARCTAWGGRLTPIYSASELSCVRTALNGGAVLLGLEQVDGAGAPSLGWSWNGDGQPPPYLPWDAGQPNDDGGGEDDDEQCAFSMAGGSNAWHDARCGDVFSRFSCRYP
jgi:hypothetical protein